MTCPSLEQLQQFLDGGLESADAAEVDRHLDSCVICQQRLDRLTQPSAPEAPSPNKPHSHSDPMPPHLRRNIVQQILAEPKLVGKPRHQENEKKQTDPEGTLPQGNRRR